VTHRPLDSSRRQFLGVAAGAVAAAALPARAGAAPPEWYRSSLEPGGPSPRAAARVALKEGETIRVGVIGLSGPGMGGMGVGHCQAFTSLARQGKEDCVIAAICDVNQTNIESALLKLEAAEAKVKPDVFTDYRKLLARDDLHAVLIATPEHWHAQMAIDAIAAGKDVYVEKPMTLRLGEALRLREVVKANPEMVLQVGTQMTNLPKYHEARRLIKEGAIGVPTFSQTSYCRNSKSGEWNYYVLRPEWKGEGAQWTPGENLDWDAWCGPLGKMPWNPKHYSRWRRYKRLSTGICGDLLVHVITPLLVAIDQGWPTRVVATGGHLVDKEMENHDNIHIAVQFETGHQTLIAGSTCNENGLTAMVRGHKGNIDLGGRHCVLRPERLFAEEIEPRTVECPDVGNDQDMHRLKWMKCIRTREQPDSDVDQGAKVMAIVDLATRSMWDGHAYEFDPSSLTARAVV